MTPTTSLNQGQLMLHFRSLAIASTAIFALIGPMLTDAAAFRQSGVGSYYGPKFHGKKTASGEKFNQNAMTAAHKTLAFGSKLRVTNIANGRSVIVRVNDRGPFIRGRIVDVSTIAARQLGMVGRGVARVRIQKL
jgi:rare lipoprotein A